MLEAVCPNGHHLQVPLEHAGMKLRCPAPGCGAIFQLSATSPTGATMPIGQPSAQPMPSGIGTGAAAPAQQPAAPLQQQPLPAPQQASGAAGSQPLSEAQSSRWTGTDQPPAQPQSAPLQRSGSGVMPRSLPLRAAPWIAWAQGLLMIGLVLVLTARGCDGLGARNIGRLKAKAEQAQQEFENAHSAELAGLQADLNAEKITDKQRADIQKRIDDLTKSHEKDRRDHEPEWTRMRNDATVAASANVAWGYWREMLFVVGTILFALGLLAMSLGGQGAERYICFGMLAIIVFSVYVGGTAWFTSLVGGLSGLGLPLR